MSNSIFADSKWLKYTNIMIFYFIISYIIFPAIFYYTMGKTKLKAGLGFVVGSIISIILWFIYGSKMV